MKRVTLESQQVRMQANTLLSLKEIVGSVALIKLASDSDLIRGLVISYQFIKICRAIAEKITMVLTDQAPNSRLHQFWLGVRALIRFPLDATEITIKSATNIVSPESLAIAIAVDKSVLQVENLLMSLPSALIQFLRQFGDVYHCDYSIHRAKIERIDSWLESISPDTIEELRDTTLALLEAFDKFPESLLGWEHVATCKFLIGVSKHFSVFYWESSHL